MFSKTHPSRHVPSSTQVAVGAEEGADDEVGWKVGWSEGDRLGLLVEVGAEEGGSDGDRLGKFVESHLPPIVAFWKE